MTARRKAETMLANVHNSLTESGFEVTTYYEPRPDGQLFGMMGMNGPILFTAEYFAMEKGKRDD